MGSKIRKIPGYGGKYRIMDDGRVVRRGDGDYAWVEVSESPKGSPDARVRLYKPGSGDRPTRRYVRTILKEVFGAKVAQEYIRGRS